MLKQQAIIFKRISMLADLAVMLISFLFAYNVRLRWGGLVDFEHYLWVMIVILPVWHVLLRQNGFYNSLRIISFPHLLSSLIKVNVIGGIITSSVIYFFEPKGYSRGLLGLFLGASCVFLATERVALKMLLSFLRKKGFNVRNIIIVGSGGKAGEFLSLLELHSGWGLNVLGFVQPGYEPLSPEIAGYGVLGREDSLVEICKSNQVDEVVFCVPPQLLHNFDKHLEDMQELGITVRMVMDLNNLHIARRELSFFYGKFPILTYYCKAFDGSQLLLKRCLDLIGAVVGLCFTALVFPFIAIAIRTDSDGPIFFSQERVGQNGRTFRCWKFRSMHVDAEERKKELLSLNEMNGAMFKIKKDPRVTRLGKFLRRTSLDELPQFWNVLRGEMSLVGTRPPTPEEVKNYENWQRKRICIKPGITGLWQISGRNQVKDFDKVVTLDIEYIEKWTLWLDIKILARTMWVVFARTGSS